jgi:cobalt-zinc-cadmium efflux system outer membrane protein
MLHWKSLLAVPFALLMAQIASAGGLAIEAPECRVGPTQGELLLWQAAERYLRCNPQLEQARAGVEAARGDLRSVGHAPNPLLGMTISNINPQVGTGAGALWHRTMDSALRVDQLIERGGKLAARRDAAGGLVRAAEAQLEDSTHRGVESLVEAYVGAAAADARAVLLADAATSYRESLAAMNQRLAAGDVSEVEVRRTSLDAAQADAEAESARIEKLRARSDVAVALGIDSLPGSVTFMPLDVLMSELRGEDAAETAARVAGDRPDLLAARARVDASEGSLRAAQAARKRDIDLTLGFDHWPTSPVNTQGTGDSYTVGISVPLFMYDSGRGGVQRAIAELRGAQSDLGARQQLAEVERQQLTGETQQAEALALRYTRELMPAANAILSAEETAYRRGGIGVLDLLDARRNTRQVAVATINARREAIFYRLRLQLALGRSPLYPSTPAMANAAASAP